MTTPTQKQLKTKLAFYVLNTDKEVMSEDMSDEELAYHLAEETGCGMPAFWWVKELVDELMIRDNSNVFDCTEYEKGFDRWLNEFFISKERDLPAHDRSIEHAAMLYEAQAMRKLLNQKTGTQDYKTWALQILGGRIKELKIVTELDKA